MPNKTHGLIAALCTAAVLAGAPTDAAHAASKPKVAANPSAGCRRSKPVSSGKVTTTVRGTERWYLRHVPPQYDGRTPLPLVVDFHGYAEGADLAVTLDGLAAKGDAMGFVTLDPEGQGFPAYWDTRPGSPDLAFARRLLDDTERNLCIDRNRVYVDGYSNGAFLTSVLACTDANRIAAVATVAGMRNPPRCKPSRAVPVIGFHGTEDVYLPYAGGLSHKAADLPAADGSGRTIGQLPKGQGGALVPGSMNDSVPTILKAWARRNGCASALRSQAVTNDTTRLSFRCPKGHEVELYRSKGAGHDWPGSRVSAAIGGAIGPTTMSIDATDLMWAFFAAHPLTKH